jgi:hypothetical protein
MDSGQSPTAELVAPTPAQEIDAKIASLNDWRGQTLANVRALIHQAVPDVVEQIKWRKPTNPAGVPVWTAAGRTICTGEIYRDKVKLTFPAGAALPDPSGLFNAGLGGGTRRAIDLREGENLGEEAFGALVRAAAG